MASSGHLKPGEKGTITATVDTTGKTGPMNKAVRVKSNDPKRPVVSLTTKAFIKAPAAVNAVAP